MKKKRAAAELLLFVAGVSLLAVQLTKIAVNSLRESPKIRGQNGPNGARSQEPLTEEERIEIVAERKEWK